MYPIPWNMQCMQFSETYNICNAVKRTMNTIKWNIQCMHYSEVYNVSNSVKHTSVQLSETYNVCNSMKHTMYPIQWNVNVFNSVKLGSYDYSICNVLPRIPNPAIFLTLQVVKNPSKSFFKICAKPDLFLFIFVLFSKQWQI